MEFALVAAPFMFMMFAVLEIGLVFVINSVLENATVETGRLIRTGQADSSGLTAEQFKTRLCERMSIFEAGCEDKVFVDVREIPQFQNPSVPNPVASGAFVADELAYENGGPGSIMLVRVWYQHSLISPFLAQGLSRLEDGSAMLSATAAFRNEPYN